jgi:hypothetical protein
MWQKFNELFSVHSWETTGVNQVAPYLREESYLTFVVDRTTVTVLLYFTSFATFLVYFGKKLQIW